MNTTKTDLSKLTTAQLDRIIRECEEIITDRVMAPRDQGQRSSGRWLQLERVKCGKTGCKRDSEDGGHGPYWYLYRTNPKTGRQTSEYIGKRLPNAMAVEFGEDRPDE